MSAELLDERSERRRLQDRQRLAQMNEQQLAERRKRRRLQERHRLAQMNAQKLADRRERRRLQERQRLAQMNALQLAEHKERRNQRDRQRRQLEREKRLQRERDATQEQPTQLNEISPEGSCDGVVLQNNQSECGDHNESAAQKGEANEGDAEGDELSVMQRPMPERESIGNIDPIPHAQHITFISSNPEEANQSKCGDHNESAPQKGEANEGDAEGDEHSVMQRPMPERKPIGNIDSSPHAQHMPFTSPNPEEANQSECGDHNESAAQKGEANEGDAEGDEHYVIQRLMPE